VNEQIFGPTAAAIKFENEDYVLELEKNYGLTADALDQLESRKRGVT
jgi:acyl-CoA reductase-like NAD-dependent aldehyde dehydrogenase